MSFASAASTRVSVPRPEDLDPSVAGLLAKLPQGPDGPLNLMAVLIHNPDAIRAWGRFTGTILFEGTLPARERELLILRTAWMVGSSYEWGNHVQIGLDAGITTNEIARLAQAQLDGGWSANDELLIRAADELHTHGGIQGQTLTQILEDRTVADVIEVIFVVGIYHVVGSLVHSLGVTDEPDKPALGVIEAVPR